MKIWKAQQENYRLNRLPVAPCRTFVSPPEVGFKDRIQSHALSPPARVMEGASPTPAKDSRRARRKDCSVFSQARIRFLLGLPRFAAIITP